MSINKIVSLLKSDNIADDLADDELQKIADDVIIGYEVDEDSRADWLETNKKAMSIIKHCEDSDGSDITRDGPFTDSSRVIYPLLAPAVIQMAARIIPQIVKNGQVCLFKVLGPDPDGSKELSAGRMTDYASYAFLTESKTWLKDTHKLCAIMSSWGTAFRQVYYCAISKKVKSELIPPEDVIINHDISCLEEAPRITVRHWMTKNQIEEKIRANIFCKIDTDILDDRTDERENADSREKTPSFEVLCQTTYLDLDDDGYAEPYQVYTLKKDAKVLGIYPAYKLKDVDFDNKNGKVLYIKRRLNIIDYHLIDDPEGKFYSIGLNYLLTHSNISITAVLRQLLDAGTLANTQGGFITKNFKTQQKNLQFEMGEFQVLDIDPELDPTKQIMPLPFKEPSQVLLGLLQLMIQASEKVGMITDVLTGDVDGVNTPATTMLAMVEASSRAFKPVIQKLEISETTEFTLWVELESEYLTTDDTGKKYVLFNKTSLEVAKSDFNLTQYAICPVADPTQSSEAHKYAKVRFLGDMLNTPIAAQMNVPQVLKYIFTEIQIPEAINFIAQPQPQQPDPVKTAELQLKQTAIQNKHEIDQLKIQLGQEKAQNDQMKTRLQAAGIQIDAQNAETQKHIMAANVAKGFADTKAKQQTAQNTHDLNKAKLGKEHVQHRDQMNVEHRKLDILAQQPDDSGSSNGTQ